MDEDAKKASQIRFRIENMYPDHYSGTFYSLLKKYKHQYGLSTEQVTDFYFEALFLLLMQSIFAIGIISDIDISKVFVVREDFYFQLCIFFTSLILHFASLFSVRNGI